MRTATRILAAVLLVACGAATGGTSTTNAPPQAPETTATTLAEEGPGDALAAARERWAEAGLDTYRFTIEDDCGECDPDGPRQVVVWDAETSAGAQPTVDGLFTQIEAAITEKRDVEVAYHPNLGHPVEIWIDREARAYDGGTHLLVRDLQAGLPGDQVSLDRLDQARLLWEGEGPRSYEFRVSIGCDCPLAGTIWERVEAGRIADWRVEYDDGVGGDISPITIDQMFSDLVLMLSSAEGVVAGGARFTGSADYHPELGYPVWVGLDIEVLEPGSELSELPPRLVFSIDHLVAVDEPEDDSDDLTAARERWEAAGIDDYRYQLTVHDILEASFSEPYLITVVGGEVAAVEPGDPGLDFSLTIDGLFDLAEEEAASGAVVDGLYDQTLGYPVFLAMRDAASTQTTLLISIQDLVDSR
ncbi:MAG TPA: DUF6174 domain-containing protein [Acidimicrobiia bacterium]|nr:DUF6174 domain-containing protein [Acidimicrobiia bacterium]